MEPRIYASDFTALSLDMLDTAFGRNFGLADTPGLSLPGDFIQAMTGPTGYMFNCGDAHTFQKRQFSFAMFSLAKRYNRADWLAPWENGMLETYCREKPAWKQDDKRLLPLVLTARCPTGEVKTGSLGWFSSESAAAPIAVMRSSCDSDAVYFGLTEGPARRNHGHMDCGAFIYESDGVRWALDLGAQNYSKLEKELQIWNMNQNSDRWKVFRYGSESHNIVRIGDQPPWVDEKGVITTATGGNVIEADLTAVFAGGADRVVRRAELFSDRSLTLTDTLQGVKPGETICWQMCTRAEAATQTDGSLLLTQGKAFLRLEKNMPGAWEVVAEEEFLKPFDQKNGKVKMVRFEVPAPASGAVELSVRFLPGGIKSSSK